jgi:hypothetical protein
MLTCHVSDDVVLAAMDKTSYRSLDCIASMTPAWHHSSARAYLLCVPCAGGSEAAPQGS